MNTQNTQQTQKGSGIKTMPVRFSAAILSASLVLFASASAQAQTWPPRLISRTVDVTRISMVDAVEFFSGEQVVYQIRGNTGSVTNPVALPTNGVAIWYATDDTYTNYFIVWTNSAQSNATGFLEFVLPTPYSALTAQTYESWVNVYGGTPTNGSTPIGVFDRLQLKVKRNASYAGTYRGPITYTNVTLDGNTYVAPGFWALHQGDLNAVITGLAASASAGTTAAFFEVYTTGFVMDVTLTNSWMTVPFASTGAVFGFSITNGVAYCATPGIFSVDSLLQFLVSQPGSYELGIFINDTLQPQTLYGPLNPSTVYDGPSIVGALMTLTNGAAVSVKIRMNDPDPNPHSVTFSPSTLKAVSTVSALASNVTVTIGGGGSGDITAVVAGTFLSGGATSGDATLNFDTNAASGRYVDEGQTNSVTTEMVTDGTLRAEDQGAAALTLFTNDHTTIVAAGTGRISVTSTTTNNATTYMINGSGAASFSAFGTVNSNWCGTVWSVATSGTNSHSVTGCTSYVTTVDTNGPAAGSGGVATNYVVSFNGTNYSGTGIVFEVGGSITNVVLVNEQVVVQSKDEAGGGGTPLWTYISSVAVTASASSLEIQGLPQTYNSLMIEGMVRATSSGSSGYGYLRLNNNSAGTYDWQRHMAAGGSPLTEQALGYSLGPYASIPYSTAPTQHWAYFEIIIHDYTNANTWKTFDSRFSRRAGSDALGIGTFTCMDTGQVASVTSVVFSAAAYGVQAGSVFNIYGKTH